MHSRLLYLWVTGVLVLPLCWGNQDEEYDEVTPTPDYDYSATLDYIFYSNSSQPMDYSLFETIGEENENEPGYPRDEAAVIGQSCLVLILGLAAQQICCLA